jgi:RNA polymerase sigma-70 factor (ECF subfamily)
MDTGFDTVEIETICSPELRSLAAECPESISDEELFALLNSGPTASERTLLFNELYRRYHNRVQTWCHRVVRNHAAAADLTQEVFLKAYRRTSSYRGDSKVSTWLFSVTRNHCLSALKRRVADPLASSLPYPRLLRDVSATGRDAEIEVLEIYQGLYRVMERYLKPLEIKVLMLHYGHGVSLSAITDSLRLSNPSGAKAYIVNSRRKLRKALEGKDALATSLRRARAA